MQTIRIIAVIVDVRELTMYRADGETIIIPQGDPRIRPLVDKTVPELRRLKTINEGRKMLGRTDFVPVFVDVPEIDINQAPSFQQDHAHFAEAEKKMGGVVKFFRMAKSKLKELAEKFTKPEPVEEIPLTGELPTVGLSNKAVIGTNDVSPVSVKSNTFTSAPAAPSAVAAIKSQGVGGQTAAQIRAENQEPDVSEDDLPLTKSMDAVNEIIANAIPSHAPEFAAQSKDETTTVVAVTEDGTIIPGMEQLDIQLRQIASKLGSPVGILKFFERVSSVTRGHTVQDLLKFMEKGELPIADDGSILVYKRLMSTNEEGVFVDCHSKKVKQKVGSHVFMDEKLVDANRRTECSNGLHVARRDYLNSFSGDVTVLAKLAPEDVIAVPHADARKLRAKGYFIIARLSGDDANNVCNNRKLTDTNLLGNAVAGNHTPILETVQITSSYGGGLIITPVGEGQESEVIMNGALHAKPLDGEEDFIAENSAVDARELAKAEPIAEDHGTVAPGWEKSAEAVPTTIFQPGGAAHVPTPAEPKYEAKAPVTLTEVQQLVADFENASTPEAKRNAAIALVEHKKKVKKSWTALGVPVAIFDDATTRAKAEVIPTEVAKPDYKPKPKAKAKAKPAAKKPNPLAGSKLDAQPVKKKAAAKPTKAMEKAAQSLPKGKPKNDDKMIKQTLPEKASQLMYNVIDGKPGAAKELLLLKKTSKKSWDYLGITESQLKQVKEAAGE